VTLIQFLGNQLALKKPITHLEIRENDRKNTKYGNVFNVMAMEDKIEGWIRWNIEN